MSRTSRRTVRGGALLGSALSVVAAVLALPGSASAAFPDTPYPQVVLDHTLTTSPFVGSSVSMRDNEGSAYVPNDASLWLADDDGRKIYEVDPFTGALKRTIGDAVFTAAAQYGGGPLAGTWRDRDFESISYDAVNDTLYAFSGKCCTTSVLPTVFRLTRDQSGVFQVDSYQPLPAGSDFTGSAWNPADAQLYVGVNSDLRTYDYVTNTPGPTFQVPKLKKITGMTFSSSGADLYVTHADPMVSRVSWATKTLVSGWTFNLSSFGVVDARAVEIIGDKFWISDGYDFRPAGDPLSHAVFVFDVTPPPPDFNIVGNPGFEAGLSGWNNNGNAAATLEQVAGGQSGSYAARLTNTSTTASTLTLNDSPNWVTTTTAATYTAKVWVRSDTGVGSAVLQLREYSGSTLVRLTSTSVALSPTWQQLTVPIVPGAPGSSTLDLNVYAYKAAAGTNVYVDDVVLNIG